MNIDENNKGYFFTDKSEKESTRLMALKIKNGIVTSLAVINMIGD
jgi:hypothetical protein